MQISKLGDLRSLQLKRYSLDSINRHPLRISRKSFISITQQSQNPSFYTPHFHLTNRLRIEDDSGNNGDDSSSTRKSLRRSLSSFGIGSGTKESWGSFVVDDGEEEVEVNKRGENEVGSAGLGHERSKWGGGGGGKVNPMRSRYDSGTRESWGSFVDDGEEEVEVNKRGENEVGSTGFGHERSKWGGGGKVNPMRSRYISGTRESRGSFVDDGEGDVEVNKRGKNEVGSAGLGHESKWGGGGGKVNPLRARYEDPVLKKKKGKDKDRFSWVCSDCGHSDGQWWGTCRSCSGVGTMVKFSVGDYNGGGLNTTGGVDVVTRKTWLSQQHQSESHRPQRLSDVNGGIDQLKWRLPLCGGMFGAEVARVLGGGLVPGSLVLVGGDPGVGKSTLVLQIAAIISAKEPSSAVVYVSGEESIEQIGNRADRMGIGAEDIYLYSSTDIEDILEKIHPLSPRALIIDSIQTVYLKEVTGSAGGLSQVKECTSALLRFSKKTNIPVFLIGHVTKTGDIAGPRVLEHIVDVVLYMEGDKSSSHRLLRSVKNRFGSTDELGVFEMSQLGLQAVLNPSEIFLSEPHSESDFLPGLAVAVIVDGSRSFLIEIQALCVSSGLTPAAIQVNGVEKSRAYMIICVLSKQAGMKIQENAAVFVNVVGGVSLKETAGDLAVAAAICSSVLEYPIPRGVAFIGEIGLGGELRMVTRMEKRLNTVAKLGYKKCIVPESALKSLAHLDFGGMHILGCKNLKEVINTVFA